MLAIGCIQAEKVERAEITVEPVVDYYALGGYTGEAEEDLFVISGKAQEVKEQLSEIVAEGVPPQSIFSTQDELNLVVFRGVFNTGGHGLEIQRVEREGNAFYVYSVYSDPGPGMMVTQAFTQPTAIIPIGKLKKGEYRATLLATQILKKKEGDQVIYEEKERKMVDFSVK